MAHREPSYYYDGTGDFNGVYTPGSTGSPNNGSYTQQYGSTDSGSYTQQCGTTNSGSYGTAEQTQAPQTELKTKVSEGRKRLSDEVQLANDAKQWVEAIQEYANITELDAATLNRLIKEIVVQTDSVSAALFYKLVLLVLLSFVGFDMPASWGTTALLMCSVCCPGVIP